MKTRRATCNCGQLTVTCEGDPVRISVCHCFGCQQRTGSAFGYQARFPRTAVTVTGRSTTYVYTADSGNTATFHFCPVCGATVHWVNAGMEDFCMVAAGAFTDPEFPSPTISLYEARRHAWVAVEAAEHWD